MQDVRRGLVLHFGGGFGLGGMWQCSHACWSHAGDWRVPLSGYQRLSSLPFALMNMIELIWSFVWFGLSFFVFIYKGAT